MTKRFCLLSVFCWLTILVNRGTIELFENEQFYWELDNGSSYTKLQQLIGRYHMKKTMYRKNLIFKYKENSLKWYISSYMITKACPSSIETIIELNIVAVNQKKENVMWRIKSGKNQSQLPLLVWHFSLFIYIGQTCDHLSKQAIS